MVLRQGAALVAALALLATIPARADEAFVTNQQSDDVSVVDLATAAVVATIPVGGKPPASRSRRTGRRSTSPAPRANTSPFWIRRPGP